MSKSGISLTLGGTSGTNWVREALYHDPLVSEAEIIYSRSDVLNAFSHNAFNNVSQREGTTFSKQAYRVIGADGLDSIPDSGDEGTIRFRVDRDLQMGVYRWAADGSTKPYYPAYSAPFSFDDLTFATGVPVIGSTGSNGQPIANKTAHYWRGVVDDFGQEWHSISVADDDTAYLTSLLPGIKAEFLSSDGKVFLFCTNPSAPTLAVSKTGDAQFYTTPPKVYFVPKIHTPTTYILPRTGSISVTLQSLGGENVFYRIVPSLSSGDDFIATDAASVTIPDSAFSDGAQFLEYYFAGSPAGKRHRVIHKNPTHPSLAESHGHRLWGNSTELARIQARLSRAPYASAWSTLRTNDSYLAHAMWDANGRTGHRWPWFLTSPYWTSSDIAMGGFSWNDAFIALTLGWTATKSGESKSYGQYALEKVLAHNWARVDPVGYEANHSAGPHPSTERIGAGYRVVNAIFQAAAAYDILAGHFRSDQVAGGMTAIEDLYIRDTLANAVVTTLQWHGNYTGTSPGMWGTSHGIASLMVATMLPSYSTPYYGTSGFDGNTTVYPWTPYPSDAFTWEQIFRQRVAPTTGYPNLAYRFDPQSSDMWLENGNWAYVNLGYADLMRPPTDILLNLSKLFSVGPFERIEMGAAKAIAGTLYGGVDATAGPAKQTRTQLGNNKFLTLGPQAVAAVKADTVKPETTAILEAGIGGLVWYDDEIETSGGSGPVDTAPAITTHPTSQTITEGQPVTFTAAASGSPFPNYQWKKAGVAIPGQTNATLTFTVSPADAGSYSCTASNVAGSATTNSATLTVLALPTPPPLVIPKRTNRRPPPAAIISQ